MTQAQLGERVGVGQSRIAAIEKNPGLMSVDQLFALLVALEVGLLLRDGPLHPNAVAQEALGEPW